MSQTCHERKPVALPVTACADKKPVIPLAMPISFDASPFAGAEQYYDRFRAPYPQAAIDFIVERYDLSEGVRALDLGCGPGTIAIPLSRSVAEVVAVDPDGEMIAEGRRLAASRGRQNIQWRQLRAEDMSLEGGPFRVTTIGQAFHWMHRDEVLRKLAILTANGGGLALVNPGKRRPQESWETVASQIVAKDRELDTRNPIRKSLNTNQRCVGQNTSLNSRFLSFRALLREISVRSSDVFIRFQTPPDHYSATT